MRLGGWCALGVIFIVGCGSSDDSNSGTGGKSAAGGASSGGGSARGGSTAGGSTSGGSASGGSAGQLNAAGGSTSAGGGTAAGGDAAGGDATGAGGTGTNGGTAGANGGTAPAGGTAGNNAGGVSAGGTAGGVSAGGTAGNSAGGTAGNGAGGIAAGGGANAGAGGANSGGKANGGSSSGGSSSGGTTSGGAASGGAASGGTTSKGGSTGSGGTGGNECPEGSTGNGCSTCVVYVNQSSGNDANNGTTWASAKASLQAGVEAAVGTTPCQVWVAQGTYVPTYKADPFAAANTATLQMRAGVALYGGFVGGERSLAARNFETNVTTITGEIGAVAQTDNLSRVVTWADGARLDGFTVTRSYGPGIECTGGKLDIQNCKVTGNFGGYTGGGLHLAGNCDARVVASSFTSNTATYSSDSRGAGINAESSTNLVVENCTFSSNASTTGSGGGIMTFGGARITGSTFENNTASNTGGGAYLAGPAAVVEDCVFRNNKANSGSAIYGNFPTVRRSTFATNTSLSVGAIYTNSITVEDSTFTGNTAINVNGATSANGGAIRASGIIKIKRSSFSDNSVSAGNSSTGGAIHCSSNCSATLVGVKFHNNSAFGLGATTTYGHGGAISFDGTLLSLTDCQFTANRARMHGGAIYNTASASTSTISAVNSTFYGNSTAAGSGGAIYNTYSASTFLNTIFWANTATVQGNQVYNNGSATSTVRSCDVQGIGTGSNGNIDQDPLFVSTTAGSLDLKLLAGSPCINKGANADVPADVLDIDDDSNVAETLPLDIDGVARIQGASVDMGAHESP